ncbi:DEAD/DEAH box helicase [Peribacillus glennii]|uniref:DEAD/DEAH box helicase n=1 Tax=Peribacillus glennii TaxID=2303991 RepID=A0A372LA17_9BACI|nr:DEAD/DEAH box helicase [Peribacillus glennii]RFU62415.1 DEAD/DEAH box helicase [Peribacillus glennii]
MEFTQLGIRSELQKILKESGIETPTAIQEKSIREIAAGRDVIARAQTGTGKTLAFLLPILEKVRPELKQVQALILSPTRELALQISTELAKLENAVDGVHAAAIYGGQDVDRQMRVLGENPAIVVATPGRLLDHVRRGTIDLSNISTLVLDEADQMLHIGFLPEVEAIIGMAPTEKQMLLFSATMPEQVRSIAKRFMKSPVTISVKSKNVTVEQISQTVIETTDRTKQATLFKVIKEEQPFMAIIFCRTKRRVSKLNEALKNAGFNSDELHGDLSQSKREQVMKRFRDAAIHLLVATDVAARGLDVEGVTHVFNYDVPEDAESYIHRIGRTGRAGGQGMAITFIAPKDRQLLAAIEKGIQLTVERKVIEGVKANPDSEPGRTQKGQRRSSEKRNSPDEQQDRKGKFRTSENRNALKKEQDKKDWRSSQENHNAPERQQDRKGKVRAPENRNNLKKERDKKEQRSSQENRNDPKRERDKKGPAGRKNKKDFLVSDDRKGRTAAGQETAKRNNNRKTSSRGKRPR